MGKAARNERIKLTATFYNNLASALMAAGVFIPIITILFKIAPGYSVYLFTIVLSTAGVICSFGLGWYFHEVALKMLNNIED